MCALVKEIWIPTQQNWNLLNNMINCKVCLASRKINLKVKECGAQSSIKGFPIA